MISESTTMTPDPPHPTASDLPWQRCPLFAALPEHHLARLCRIVVPKAFAKGAFLFHEGQPCNGFYVLLAGAVLLTRFTGADGRETPLHPVAPGQSFAEAALFGRRAFPASAVATLPSRVAFFPGPAFLAQLQEDPELALALLASQSRWLQRLVARLAQLGSQDAEARLREWLRDAAAGTGVARIQGTKKDLAAQLGMTPETLSRTLAVLRRAGLVAVEGRRILLQGPL